MHTKKRAFSFATFDFLRFSTTLYLQIYARKLTLNMSVHKPCLKIQLISKSVEFSENQVLAYYAFSLALSCAMYVYVLFILPFSVCVFPV